MKIDPENAIQQSIRGAPGSQAAMSKSGQVLVLTKNVAHLLYEDVRSKWHLSEHAREATEKFIIFNSMFIICNAKSSFEIQKSSYSIPE